MLKLYLNIILLIIANNLAHGQNPVLLKAGVNLFGVMTKTLDAEIQLMINPTISFALSGGRQFDAKVPEIINTENGKASGNFIRAGVIFNTGSAEDRARILLRADAIYATLKHTTTVNFIDYYGPFNVPYEHHSNRMGISFGLGVMPTISRKLEMDFYLAFTYTSSNEPFMLNGYPLPGFYNGLKIFEKDKPTKVFVKMCLNFKYKFNFSKK